MSNSYAFRVKARVRLPSLVNVPLPAGRFFIGDIGKQASFETAHLLLSDGKYAYVNFFLKGLGILLVFINIAPMPDVYNENTKLVIFYITKDSVISNTIAP